MGETEVKQATVEARRYGKQIRVALPNQTVYLELPDAEQLLSQLPEAIRDAKERKIEEARSDLDRARAQLKALGVDC